MIPIPPLRFLSILVPVALPPSDFTLHPLDSNCTSDGHFMCKRGDISTCLDVKFRCDGIAHCDQATDELLSVCGNCSSESKFACKFSGRDLCLNKTRYQCDGIVNCDNVEDELMSVCGNDCSDETKFSCKTWPPRQPGVDQPPGLDVCVNKAEYRCNARYECTDSSDEAPSVCANCSKPGLSMCRDGSMCTPTDFLCDRFSISLCADGSDDSDTWSNCTVCARNDTVECPGFPGNCAKVCDGRNECPDLWDEMLSTCNAYGKQCTEKYGLYPCTDGSRCLSLDKLCNYVMDCDNREDEAAVHCGKDKCQSFLERGLPVHSCDGDSCILRTNACGSKEQPLCKDGSDMNSSLCVDRKGNRACYANFPGKVHPYRWPCNDGTKCILRTSRCDANRDCDDWSDEIDCPWYVSLKLVHTVLVCLAVMLQSFLLHLLFSAWSRSLTNSHSVVLSSTVTLPQEPLVTSPLTQASPESSTPSFLLHPALLDLEGRHWCWQDVGKELKIEVIFFNRDTKFLLSFLSAIEAQDTHPDNVYQVFKGFFQYLETEGYTPVAVAFSMKKSIGYHHLARMALKAIDKGPPTWLERKIYRLRKWVEEVEGRNKFFFVLISICQTLKSCSPSFLLYLDYVKDFVVYSILRGTVQRLVKLCEGLSQDQSCPVSEAEKILLDTLLLALTVSIVSSSLHAFHQRHHFFATNRVFDSLLFILSPFLTAIYHIQVGSISQTLKRERKSITNLEYQSRKQHLAKLRDILQQSKSIEVGVEAVTQILVLCGLATFKSLTFKGPSGQTYSYFHGVALLVLKGNAALFGASILISFLGPCFFFMRNENHKMNGSFSTGSKIVLFLRNFLFLLARLGATISALFLPVICRWDVFIGNQGVDASSRLSFPPIGLEFGRHFSVSLQQLSDEIVKNTVTFMFFLLVHLLVVATHAILRSPKFGKSTMRERWLHLLTSLWLPLPFLTIREVNKGEEKPELRFLVSLHTCENLLLLCVSRWVYLPVYPSVLLVLDFSIVTFNTLAVALSVVYTCRLELYANVPDSVQNLPSFGPEVSLPAPQYVSKWIHLK